jgi:hypothetical protein
MKYLSTFALLVFCLVLATGSAVAAEKHAIVTPVSGEAIPINPTLVPTGADGVCGMGNLNPIAFALTDWIWGAEKYASTYYADPAQCTACTEGFAVESVNLVMQFGVADVPSTFGARVNFQEALWDEALQCNTPGPEICVSSEYTVTIDTPGLYNITLPMDSACACAQFGYWYGIGFEFTTAFTTGMEPDMVSDEFPVGCTSWNDYGSGWIDTIDFGFPGEISLSAEIVCCNNPVAAEQDTWGDIKAMFR